MWHRREPKEGNSNSQLLTLVHGVDRRGRPLIQAYTGNAILRPVYQEYQDAINKQYQKAARPSKISKNDEPRCRVTDSSDFLCDSSGPSTQRIKRVSPHWTPALSGARSQLKGLRATVSRLRCSLVIHSGLGSTDGELNYLPLIPVRCKKTGTWECPKKGFSKVAPSAAKERQDCEIDLKRECHTTPKSQAQPYKTCNGSKDSAGFKIKAEKRQNKKKGLPPQKLKPKLRQVKDMGSFRTEMNSKYLIS